MLNFFVNNIPTLIIIIAEFDINKLITVILDSRKIEFDVEFLYKMGGLCCLLNCTILLTIELGCHNTLNIDYQILLKL